MTTTSGTPDMGTMYDSTRPSRIPLDAAYIAIYGNGLWPASRDQVQRQHPHASIYTIDVLGSDPGGCGIADVENGDMAPAQIPGWVDARLRAHPGALCRIYCNKSTWPSAQSYAGKLPGGQLELVRWWIADPTGTAHMVPGADATQWDWGYLYDESLILATFLEP